MNFGQAFAFIGEDENWMKKLGIGVLVSLVPFLNFAALGYQVQISRNVAKGEKRPLPNWDNLGDLFLDGLRVIGAMFVYMLPMLFLYGLAMLFAVISLDSAAFAETSSGSAQPIPTAFITMLGVMLLCSTPYTLLIWLLWPLLSIQIARKKKFSACFDFKEMWQLVRQDWVNYLLVVGIYLGLTMAASFVVMPVALVLIFIPCLGIFATMGIQGAVMMLTQAVNGHLQGQFIQLNDTNAVLPSEQDTNQFI